jgi:hypothetical protein
MWDDYRHKMEGKFIATRRHTVAVTGVSWASRHPSKGVTSWTMHRARGVQTAQLPRRKYTETRWSRNNWHMWRAHQCESNTSSTWYDIRLKKHQRIKARRRREPDAWGFRSTVASDQAVLIAWQSDREPKWTGWRHVQGLVMILQIFIRTGGSIITMIHKAERNPKIES